MASATRYIPCTRCVRRDGSLKVRGFGKEKTTRRRIAVDPRSLSGVFRLLLERSYGVSPTCVSAVCIYRAGVELMGRVRQHRRRNDRSQIDMKRLSISGTSPPGDLFSRGRVDSSIRATLKPRNWYFEKTFSSDDVSKRSRFFVK